MSTENQRYSLENQAEVIGAYARREGYEIIATYEDSGRSGVTISRRPGLRALLRDAVGEPAFKAVLVLDVSRWGRFQNPDEAAHYEFVCRQAGLAVRYCAESFDEDGTPTAALMKSLKRVMAAEYSRQLSDRCRVGLRRAATAGTRAGGRAPFGFVRQVYNSDGSPGTVLGPGERRLRSDQVVRLAPGSPEDITTLRRIFRLFVEEHVGPTEIGRRLDEEGVSYNRPGGWTVCRVKAALTNEIATGVFVFNRTVWRLGRMESAIPRSGWRRVKVTEPVIEPALFARAQSRFFGRKGFQLSDADLLDQARTLLQARGFLSRRLIEDTPGMSCAATYIRRFGSMTEVYRRVGYTRSGRRGEHVSDADLELETVVAGLKRLLRAHGYLSAALINQAAELPYSDTIRRRFGSLPAIYRLAGYDVSPRDVLAAAWERRRAAGPTRRARLSPQQA